MDNLIEKDKTYEDNVKHYTSSVYNNLIENIDNLNKNNDIIVDNNTLSKNGERARKIKKDEDEESTEKLEGNQNMQNWKKNFQIYLKYWEIKILS